MMGRSWDHEEEVTGVLLSVGRRCGDGGKVTFCVKILSPGLGRRSERDRDKNL